MAKVKVLKAFESAYGTHEKGEMVEMDSAGHIEAYASSGLIEAPAVEKALEPTTESDPVAKPATKPAGK